MALPTLDATFASSADLPRRQMLAKWLVEELGETQAPSNVLVSGAGSDVNGIYTVFGEQNGRPSYERQGGESIIWDGTAWVIGGSFDGYFGMGDVEYPWLVETWTLGNGEEPLPTVTESPAPSPISNYYDLPERYLWAKIAVAAGGPKTEADYISLPKNYAWSDIYNAVSGDIANSTVVVSGLSDTQYNGNYVYDGLVFGRPSYKFGTFIIRWNGGSWILIDGTPSATSDSDVAYPWLATGWYDEGIDPTGLVLIPQTPNHTDWSENVALGHIAAAYRGDTANPENLATYINWPWRYKVASIIDGVGPTFPSDGLLAFWKLDDLTDASGNGNTLTNTNGVTFVAGKIGSSAVFDGGNFLRSTINVDFNLEFCISLWCKPDNTGNYGVMVGGSGGGTINMSYTGSNSFDFNNASVGHINVAATPSVWQHLVFNSDGTTDQAWVNGVLVVTENAQSRSPTTRIDLGSLTNSYFYFGQLDAVGVWSRDLTSEEIAQLYNNGNGVEP